MTALAPGIAASSSLTNLDAELKVCVFVCVCVRMRVRARTCLLLCMHGCMHGRVCMQMRCICSLQFMWLCACMYAVLCGMRVLLGKAVCLWRLVAPLYVNCRGLPGEPEVNAGKDDKDQKLSSVWYAGQCACENWLPLYL